MVLIRLATAYSGSLIAAPLPTKALTAAAVAVAGDALAQNLDPSQMEYSMRRGQGFALFGASYTGCFQHCLFGWLNELTPAGLLGAVEATAFNQLIIVPMLYLPLFLCVSGFVTGQSRSNIVDNARARYLPILRRNWSFWLPVQCAIFALLAPELFVPAMCLCSLCWNVMLSSLAYRPPEVVRAMATLEEVRAESLVGAMAEEKMMAEKVVGTEVAVEAAASQVAIASATAMAAAAKAAGEMGEMGVVRAARVKVAAATVAVARVVAATAEEGAAATAMVERLKVASSLQTAPVGAVAVAMAYSPAVGVMG